MAMTRGFLDSQPAAERRSAPRDDPARRLRGDEIFTLARAAEVHDPATGAHLCRIRILVARLAGELGIDRAAAEAMGEDAMLHDVGKLCIPGRLLRKPGALTDAERRAMEAHTIHGERLIATRVMLDRAARIARSHHECWDGSGHPDGLAGTAIPLEARITAVADRFDALVSRRAYKAGWTLGEAVEEIVRLAGRTLDPDIVRALSAIHARGGLDDLPET